MPGEAVATGHKKYLSVPNSFKACVSSKSAKSDGGRELEKTLDYFTEKIREVERKVVDATDIVNFLVTKNDENLLDNYYLDTKTRKIRTAVVKCNFTDSDTLKASVEDKCHEHKVERVIVSSNATSVQDTLEEIKEKKCHTIVVIEQLESMNVDVFNRLISLLAYEELDVSLLICICTSRSAFVSHCQGDSWERLLFPKFIELPSPQEQFKQVAEALARNEDEKAPNLFLSGELLLFLKRRFLLGDFSLSELKKIVRFSIVENYLKYDEYLEKEDDNFVERLPVYWVWHDALLDLIKEAHSAMNIEPGTIFNSKIDLHSDLQRDPKGFWKEHESVKCLQTWMCDKNREELCGLIECLATVVEDDSPEEAKKLQDRVDALRADAAASLAAAASPSTPGTLSTPGGGTPGRAAPKMKMSQLLAQNRAKQATTKAPGNRLRDAVGEVLGMLREQLFAWSEFEDYLLMVPRGIEIPDLSQSLMTRANTPLSHAYTALAGIDQFKAVPITRWGAMVAERMGNAEFYDCVAQLERMGAIKDMSKQGRRAVMLQHRPMMTFN